MLLGGLDVVLVLLVLLVVLLLVEDGMIPRDPQRRLLLRLRRVQRVDAAPVLGIEGARRDGGMRHHVVLR